MRIDKALIVFRKDWLEIRRNWEILLPMLLVPLMFSIVLPSIITAVPGNANSTSTKNFTQNLPDNIKQEISGLDSSHSIAYVMLVLLFAPLFLIIPLMTSSVISADSFAGEKERKTTEALLATPLTDSELFIGKVLVAFLPSMAVTIFSFAVYSGITDFVFLGTGKMPLPNLSWIMMIFMLAPALSLMGIGISVLVSSKVKGFREAQQVSALTVIPVLALMFSQISGLLFLGPSLIILLSLAVFAAAVIILRIGIGIFNRESLLERIG